MSEHSQWIFTHKCTFSLMENGAHLAFSELPNVQQHSLMEDLGAAAVLPLCCSPFAQYKIISSLQTSLCILRVTSEKHLPKLYLLGLFWKDLLRPYSAIALSLLQQGSPVGTSPESLFKMFWILFCLLPKYAGDKCFQGYSVCVWTFPAHLFQRDKLALIALLPEHDFSIVPSGFLWPHY